MRKAAAALIGFVLAMVLLTTLLLTGFYLLVQAVILALSPLLGEAGAMGLVGFVCVFFLALFFLRLTRPAFSGKRRKEANGKSGSGIDVLRDLIKENPLEAALMAFAVGIAEQGDPRLKSLLLQGGMVLMKRADSGVTDNSAGTGEASAQDNNSPADQGTAP
ncbi:hypothetical protein [Marinobacter metalliresistant]|uniref:Phage holin family protein n=1 Tax=Marinobacter metalliresistant TaxID=2961995 RepID=A0ABZ2VY38_9GAMM